MNGPLYDVTSFSEVFNIPPDISSLFLVFSYIMRRKFFWWGFVHIHF